MIVGHDVIRTLAWGAATAGAVGMAAAVGVVAAAGVAVAKPSPSPVVAPAAVNRHVTVTVDNNETSVLEHARTVYRITVRNDSDVDYPQAFVAQMLPGTLTFGDAEPAPSRRTENTLESAHTSEVQWVRHLPAHGEVTIEMTAAVGSRPKTGTLSTTACVLPDGKTRPLICDTDEDAVGAKSFSFAWLGVVLAAVGAAALLGNRFVRRRRKAAAQAA